MFRRKLLTVAFISLLLTLALAAAAAADDVREWNEGSSLPTKAGSYVLTCDVNPGSTWNVTSDVVLDLAGHDITFEINREAIIIITGGALTIKGDGTVFYRSASGWERHLILVSGGMFCLYDATLTSSVYNCLCGAGVYVESGTFNMYSGAITGCGITGTADLKGGAVGVNSGAVFNMYGGAITGNTARNGGGAYFAEGSAVRLLGGEISMNTAASRGGGIYTEQKTTDTFEMSGGVRITGNTAGGRTNGLDLLRCPVITVTGEFTGTAGVTSEASSNDSFVIGSGFSGTGVFVSDKEGYAVGERNGNIILGRARTVTYLANDGTSASSPDQAAHGSDYPVSGCPFTRTGYVFDRWDTDPSGTGTPYAPGDRIPVEGEDVTLYAQWKEAVPEFSGHSVTLTGEVGVNFLMILPEGLDYTGSCMEFTVQNKTVTVPVSSAVAEESGKYRFTCFVSSIQMAEKVTPVFRYAGGTKAVSGDPFSVKDYIDYVQANSSSYPGAISLVNALADYGYYAQVRLSQIRGWRIGTDYTGMTGTFTQYTAAQKSEIADIVSGYGLTRTFSETHISSITYSIDFLSKPLIYLYIRPRTAPDDIKAFEGQTELTVEERDDGRFRVIIPAGMIYSADTVHDVSVMSGGSEIASIKISGFSYIKALIGSDNSDETNFMTAYYRFFDEARKYNKIH
ncbi:MAG: InlB B-repeat-containing protein [Clostridia bacterium]|nr:InlB B-repeat-containing protein [Clostridia bacterium]